MRTIREMVSVPNYPNGTATHTTTPQATPSPTKAHHTGYDRITPHNPHGCQTKSQHSTNLFMAARPSPSTLRTRHDHRGRIMFTPPSKPERLGWATFYSIFAVGGAVVLISPPRTIGGPLGDILITVWGILWVSALIPAWASLYNKYRLEYPTITLVTAGVAIYAANIWAQVPDTPTRATPALTVTALPIA